MVRLYFGMDAVFFENRFDRVRFWFVGGFQEYFHKLLTMCLWGPVLYFENGHSWPLILLTVESCSQESMASTNGPATG